MSNDMAFNKMNDFKEEIYDLFDGHVFDVKILAIIDSVCDSAAGKYVSAAYSGSMSDNGAGLDIQKLKQFLVGVYFQQTGELINKQYKEIVDKKFDPEYAEFVRLSAKFKV